MKTMHILNGKETYASKWSSTVSFPLRAFLTQFFCTRPRCGRMLAYRSLFQFWSAFEMYHFWGRPVPRPYTTATTASSVPALVVCFRGVWNQGTGNCSTKARLHHSRYETDEVVGRCSGSITGSSSAALPLAPTPFSSLPCYDLSPQNGAEEGVREGSGRRRNWWFLHTVVAAVEWVSEALPLLWTSPSPSSCVAPLSSCLVAEKLNHGTSVSGTFLYFPGQVSSWRIPKTEGRWRSGVGRVAVWIHVTPSVQAYAHPCTALRMPQRGAALSQTPFFYTVHSSQNATSSGSRSCHPPLEMEGKESSASPSPSPLSGSATNPQEDAASVLKVVHSISLYPCGSSHEKDTQASSSASSSSNFSSMLPHHGSSQQLGSKSHPRGGTSLALRRRGRRQQQQRKKKEPEQQQPQPEARTSLPLSTPSPLALAQRGIPPSSSRSEDGEGDHGLVRLPRTGKGGEEEEKERSTRLSNKWYHRNEGNDEKRPSTTPKREEKTSGAVYSATPCDISMKSDSAKDSLSSSSSPFSRSTAAKSDPSPPPPSCKMSFAALQRVERRRRKVSMNEVEFDAGISERLAMGDMLWLTVDPKEGHSSSSRIPTSEGAAAGDEGGEQENSRSGSFSSFSLPRLQVLHETHFSDAIVREVDGAAYAKWLEEIEIAGREREKNEVLPSLGTGSSSSSSSMTMTTPGRTTTTEAGNENESDNRGDAGAERSSSEKIRQPKAFVLREEEFESFDIEAIPPHVFERAVGGHGLLPSWMDSNNNDQNNNTLASCEKGSVQEFRDKSGASREAGHQPPPSLVQEEKKEGEGEGKDHPTLSASTTEIESEGEVTEISRKDVKPRVIPFGWETLSHLVQQMHDGPFPSPLRPSLPSPSSPNNNVGNSTTTNAGGTQGIMATTATAKTNTSTTANSTSGHLIPCNSETGIINSIPPSPSISLPLVVSCQPLPPSDCLTLLCFLMSLREQTVSQLSSSFQSLIERTLLYVKREKENIQKEKCLRSSHNEVEKRKTMDPTRVGTTSAARIIVDKKEGTEEMNEEVSFSMDVDAVSESAVDAVLPPSTSSPPSHTLENAAKQEEQREEVAEASLEEESAGPLLQWSDIIQYLDDAPPPRRGFTEDLTFSPPQVERKGDEEAGRGSGKEKKSKKKGEGSVVEMSSLLPRSIPLLPFPFSLDYRRPAFLFTLYLENIALQNAIGHICMLFSLPLHSFHTRTQSGKMSCASLLCALAPGCLCRHHLLLLNTLRYPGFVIRVSGITEVGQVRDGVPKDVANFFGVLARWQPVYYTELLLRRVNVREDEDAGGGASDGSHRRHRHSPRRSPKEMLEQRIRAIREVGAIHFCLNRDTALARAASDVLHGFYKSAVFHALQRPYPPLAMSQFFRSPSEITASKARAVSTDATIRGILKAYLQVEGNWEATIQRTPYAWRRRWLNALRGIIWNVMASTRIRYGHRLYKEELAQWGARGLSRPITRAGDTATSAITRAKTATTPPRPYRVVVGDVVVLPEYREDARRRQVLTLKPEYLMVVKTEEEAASCMLQDVYIPFLRGKYPTDFFAPEDTAHPIMRYSTIRKILEKRSALALLVGLPPAAQYILDARSERSPLLFRRLLIRPLALSVDILVDKVPMTAHAHHYDAARFLQPDRWPSHLYRSPRLHLPSHPSEENRYHHQEEEERGGSTAPSWTLGSLSSGVRWGKSSFSLAIPSPQEKDVLCVAPVLTGTKAGHSPFFNALQESKGKDMTPTSAAGGGDGAGSQSSLALLPAEPPTGGVNLHPVGALVSQAAVLAHSSLGSRLPAGMGPSAFFQPPSPSDYLVLAQTHRFDRPPAPGREIESSRHGATPFHNANKLDPTMSTSSDPVLLSSAPLTPPEYLQDKVYTLHIKAVCHSAAVGLAQILREYFILSGVREYQENTGSGAGMPMGKGAGSSTAHRHAPAPGMDDETLQHKIHRYWREMDPETPLLTAESFCPICYNRDHVSQEQCAEYLWKRMKERRAREQKERILHSVGTDTTTRGDNGQEEWKESPSSKKSGGGRHSRVSSRIQAGPPTPSSSSLALQEEETWENKKDSPTYFNSTAKKKWSVVEKRSDEKMPSSVLGDQDGDHSAKGLKGKTQNGEGTREAGIAAALQFRMEWELCRPSRLCKWGLHFTKSSLLLTGVDTPEVVVKAKLYCVGRETQGSALPSEVVFDLDDDSTTSSRLETVIPLDDVLQHWREKEKSRLDSSSATHDLSSSSFSSLSPDWCRAIRRFLSPFVRSSSSAVEEKKNKDESIDTRGDGTALACSPSTSARGGREEEVRPSSFSDSFFLDTSSLKILHTLIPVAASSSSVSDASATARDAPPRAVDGDDHQQTANEVGADFSNGENSFPFVSSCRWKLTSINGGGTVRTIHDVAEAYLSFSHQRKISLQFSTPWTPPDALFLPLVREMKARHRISKNQTRWTTSLGERSMRSALSSSRHPSPSADYTGEDLSLSVAPSTTPRPSCPSHVVRRAGRNQGEAGGPPVALTTTPPPLPSLPAALYIDILEPLTPPAGRSTTSARNGGSATSRGGWGLCVLENLRWTNLDEWVMKSFQWEWKQQRQAHHEQHQLWVRPHGPKVAGEIEWGKSNKAVQDPSSLTLVPEAINPVRFHASSPPPSSMFFSSWADILRHHFDPQHPHAMLRSFSTKHSAGYTKSREEVAEEEVRQGFSSSFPPSSSNEVDYDRYYILYRINGVRVKSIRDIPSLLPSWNSSEAESLRKNGTPLLQLELRLREEQRKEMMRKNANQLEGVVRHHQILAHVVQRMQAHTAWSKDKRNDEDSDPISTSSHPTPCTREAALAQEKEGTSKAVKKEVKGDKGGSGGSDVGDDGRVRHQTASTKEGNRRNERISGTCTSSPMTAKPSLDVLCTSHEHQEFQPASEAAALRQATVTVHRPLSMSSSSLSASSCTVDPPKWGISLKKNSLLLRHIEHRHGYNFQVYAYTSAQVRRLERGLHKLPTALPRPSTSSSSGMANEDEQGERSPSSSSSLLSAEKSTPPPMARAYRSHMYLLEEVNHLPVRSALMAKIALQRVSRGESLEEWRRREVGKVVTASSPPSPPSPPSSRHHIPEVVLLRIRDLPLLRVTVRISRVMPLAEWKTEQEDHAASQHNQDRPSLSDSTKGSTANKFIPTSAAMPSSSSSLSCLSTMYAPIGLHVDSDVCLIGISPQSPAMLALKRCGLAPHCSLSRVLQLAEHLGEGQSGGVTEPFLPLTGWEIQFRDEHVEEEREEIWEEGRIEEGEKIARGKRREMKKELVEEEMDDGENRSSSMGRHHHNSIRCINETLNALCAFPSLVAPLKALIKAVYASSSASASSLFSIPAAPRRPVASTHQFSSSPLSSPVYDWDKDDDEEGMDVIDGRRNACEEQDAPSPQDQHEKKQKIVENCNSESPTKEAHECVPSSSSGLGLEIRRGSSLNGTEKERAETDGKVEKQQQQEQHGEDDPNKKEVGAGDDKDLPLAASDIDREWVKRVEEAMTAVEKMKDAIQQDLFRCSRVDGCQVLQLESLTFFLCQLRQLISFPSSCSFQGRPPSLGSSGSSREDPCSHDAKKNDRLLLREDGRNEKEKKIKILLNHLSEEWIHSYRQVKWRVVYATEAKKPIYTPKDLAEVFAPGVMEETIILQQCVFA